ncbi:MAG: hypothetical protein KC561_07960, partial [Myxococcales bacterium]|nr:hypothetical protein [Myxococcales bacterium]
GTIAFIDPTVDSMRQIVQARVEVENPDGTLRPGTSVTALIQPSIGAEEHSSSASLAVPSSAVLWTGQRSFVFVEHEMGGEVHYQPVQVLLGAAGIDSTEILDGLSEGQRVVTHGAFRLDSELQIRGDSSMMNQEAEAAHEHLH